MAELEEMFKYHGSLGPCPKPPLPSPIRKGAVEYFFREADEQFWLDVKVDGHLHDSIFFDSAAERERAYADLLSMVRSVRQ